jgi:hypothetical protein
MSKKASETEKVFELMLFVWLFVVIEKCRKF